MQTPSKTNYTVIYALYAIVAVIFLGPIIFMAWCSFRLNVDITAAPPKWFGQLTLDNFTNLFREQDFGRYFGNTVVVAGGSTLLGLCLGAPAAYVFARSKSRAMPFITLVARMAPGVLYVIPLFAVATLIGAPANNSLNYGFLIASHLIITLPLCVWFLVPFFEGIPRSIEEAALLDGCSPVRVFALVALPLVRPGLSVALTFSFLFSWNYFLFALVLANPDTLTLPVIALSFIGQGQADWGGLMAAAVLIASPAVVLAAVAQRVMVRGLITGSTR